MLGSPRSHSNSSWTSQDLCEEKVELDLPRDQRSAPATTRFNSKEDHFPDLSISLDFLRQQPVRQLRLARPRHPDSASDLDRRSLSATDSGRDEADEGPVDGVFGSTERSWRRSLAVDSHPIHRPLRTRSASRDAVPGADRGSTRANDGSGGGGSGAVGGGGGGGGGGSGSGFSLGFGGNGTSTGPTSSVDSWQIPTSSSSSTNGAGAFGSHRNPSSANDFSPFLDSSSPSSLSSFSSRPAERCESESRASHVSSSAATPLHRSASAQAHSGASAPWPPLQQQQQQQQQQGPLHRNVPRDSLGESNDWLLSSSPGMSSELNREGRRPPIAKRSLSVNTPASSSMPHHYAPQSPGSHHSASPGLPDVGHTQAGTGITASAAAAAAAAAASSPRVGLETMLEESGGLEDSGLATRDGDSHFFSHPPLSATFRPGRLRSTSSAAALQKYDVPQGTYDNWSRSASAWEGGTSPGTYAYAAQQHLEGRFPDRILYDDDDADADADHTAVQSPAERGRRPILTANEASALATSHGSENGPLPSSGTESRRHSIATAAAATAAVGGQHRAIGFEVNRPTPSQGSFVPGQQSYPRPIGGSTSSGRGGGGGGYGLFGGGSLAISDDDLAADLGSSLRLNLDQVAVVAATARQQHMEQVHMRVPSSAAAATGAHAASMPPMFGERTLSQASPARYSAIDQGRRAVPTDMASSSWDFLNQSSGAFGSPNRARAQSTSADFGAHQPLSHAFSTSPATERHLSMSPQSKTFSMGPVGQPQSPSYFGTSPFGTSSSYIPGLPGRIAPQQQQPQQQHQHTFQHSHQHQHPQQIQQPSHHHHHHQQQQQQQHPQQQHGSALDSTQHHHRHHSSSSPSLASFSGGGGGSGGGSSGGSAGAVASGQVGAPLSDYAIASLSSLGPIAPISGGHQDGPSSLQELGRGVPLQMLPRDTPLYIVEFKQGRTDLYFRQSQGRGSGRRDEGEIAKGDLVIVEADRGKDLGTVVNDSITVDQVQNFLAHQTDLTREPSTSTTTSSSSTNSGGGGTSNNVGGSGSGSNVGAASSVVPLSRLTRNINPKRLFSKATPAETSLLHSKAQDEERALALCTAKVNQRGLPMIVVAAEMQWDRRKLTFYYTATQRVDFRDLVKELFRLYKVRIYLCHLSSNQPGQGSDQLSALSGSQASP